MTTHTSPPRRHLHAFRALLLLYPSAYRDEYGREMALVFDDRYRDARSAGARARLWMEAVAGILVHAPREHARLLLHDVRSAARQLRRRPAFALLTIATLGLAVGASTAMFSVTYAAVLRPLPYPSPDRLVMAWTSPAGSTAPPGRSVSGIAQIWHDSSQSLSMLAALEPASLTVVVGGEAMQTNVTRAMPEVFPLLGVQLAAGRVFTSDEAREGEPVVVVSHRFWQTSLAGAPDAIGSSITISGRPLRLVGIMRGDQLRPRFDFDLVIPHTLAPEWEAGRLLTTGGPWFVLARLGDDVSMTQAQTELQTLLNAAPPPAVGRPARTVSVTSLESYVTPQGGTRATLWLLTAATVGLLLIAAANVAGLALARNLDRQGDTALRVALGASRRRLMREAVAESAVLAAPSAAVGALVAIAGVRWWQALPAGQAAVVSPAFDPAVIAWALITPVLAMMAVAAGPAIATARIAAASGGVSAGGRRVIGGPTARRWRRVFVVGQCAATLVLLVGAGLLLRSWWHVLDVDPGFRADQLLVAQVATSPAATGPERVTFFRELRERLEAMPDVQMAGLASEVLVSGAAELPVTAEGSGVEDTQVIPLRIDEAAPGYFETLGVSTIEGRTFNDSDGADGPRIAVINRRLAQQLWPDRSAIGRRLAIGRAPADDAWTTVVGVIDDMHRQGLERDPVPEMFQLVAQNPPRGVVTVVRTSHTDPLQLVGSIRAIVRTLDAGAVVYGTTTLTNQLDRQRAPRFLQTRMMAGFAIVALVLSALGVYGLLQQSVVARTREVGVRLAVGAGARDIFVMILREGLTLAAAGLAIGVTIALMAAGAINSLLFGVNARDPWTFAAVVPTLAIVALAAAALPAFRAARIAPSVALRQGTGE